MRLVVVGDALLDRDLEGRADRLAPDAPVPVLDSIEERARPGGAGLAAALAARATTADVEVTLVCALGDDAAGRRLAGLLADAGVELCDLGLRGATPEKVRVCAGGRALVRLDAGGAAAACGPLTAAAAAALHDAAAVLVSDYGRGVTAEPSIRAAVSTVPGDRPIVWDPHPNGPDPVPGVLLATPNEREAADRARPLPTAVDRGARREAAQLARPLPTALDRSDAPQGSLAAAEAAARALVARWRAVNVGVTRGADGAVLVGGDGPALAVPAPAVMGGDPCGAGDSFAATAAVWLAHGALPSEAVVAAVHTASAFVAAGGASAALDPPKPPQRGDPVDLARRVRAGGGTVVATGGCFDLLHAGHVRMLQAARALGDCLIVCLNSDASVRRLKGPDRPLVSQDDRAAVLAELGCVDAVAIFDEDTPSALLQDLRPHVWAKGGDYALADLPEADVLAGWGGRTVLVPYVSGRSTTRLIDEARRRTMTDGNRGRTVAHD